MTDGLGIEKVNAGGIEIEREAILARMGTELKLAGPASKEAWPAIRDAARSVPQRAYRSVILTGCGDSFYAATALRSLVESAAGVPTIAVPAMEAATFPSLLADRDALLVGISVSGKVERTIEAVSKHCERGGATAAISAFADSNVAGAADAAVPTGLRGTPGPVPGTANFLGSMLGIVAIAAELGARAGRPPAWESAVGDVLGALARAVDDGEGHAARIVATLRPMFCSLGSGPDLGTAWYGVAKFVEAAATFGIAQDLEEWAHEQYFTSVPGTTVFVHATTSGAVARARRVSSSVLKIGASLVTVGTEPLGLTAEHHWPTADAPEALRPLVAWVPMAVAARAYAIHAGRFPFGIDLPDRMRTVDEDIYLAHAARA